MILLDTHTLLWWILDPPSLSKNVLELIEKTPTEKRLLSSMSLWEIYHLSKKGKIVLNLPEEEFTKRLTSSGQLKMIDANWNILHRSVFLKWKHTDPIDRILVATAIEFKSTLLTKDKIIQKFYRESFW
jgi:PIN domain nuclease of toxin-antitoxin system